MKTRTGPATLVLFFSAAWLGSALGADLPGWKGAPVQSAPRILELPQRTAARVEIAREGFLEGQDALALSLRKQITLPALVPASAAPRSLASHDLNGDGIADLVCGYALEGAGLLVVYPGNIDSFFPRRPEALARRASGAFSDSPFLSSAIEVHSPVAPDLLAAGDFDADGFGDLVLAARGDAALYLFSGDGRGRFRTPQRVVLAAGITALVAGEVNRADGSIDLAVGVADVRKSASLLVFAAPGGVFQRAPRVIPIPEAATALALGTLDADTSYDLAAAAGSRLVVVHGLDGTDAASRVEIQGIGGKILALAIGRFLDTPGRAESVALLVADGSLRYIESGRAARRETLPAFASSRPALTRIAAGGQDRPLILDRGRDSGSPAALAMQLNDDALADLVAFAPGRIEPSLLLTLSSQTFVVDSEGDEHDADLADGKCISTTSYCTLRAAIEQANTSADLDTIVFASNVNKITTSGLHVYNNPVTIDGLRANGSHLKIWGGGSVAHGFDVVAGSCVLRSMVIGGFQCAGIFLRGNGNRVEDCWVGSSDEVLGEPAYRNGWGIEIHRSYSNTIGGSTLAARNVLVNNRIFGVGAIGDTNEPAHDNWITGNYIGTAKGDDATPNGGGSSCTNPPVYSAGVNLGIESGAVTGNNRITGNVVSGNQGPGVRLTGTGDLVQGNTIGTNNLGTVALMNTGSGVEVAGSGVGGHTIGGFQGVERNLISGNGGNGVYVVGPCGSGAGCNKIYGNLIGTDVSGDLALGNGAAGVRLESTSFADVGHAASPPGAVPGNVISGNAADGITIVGGGAHSIAANLIGTKQSGSAALANAGNGIRISSTSSDNRIGSASASDRNVISGNGSDGVEIDSSSANYVQGNYIGTNASGSAALANLGNGVLITGTSQARYNIVGGTPQVAGTPPGNVISGNRQNGVLVSTTFASYNRVGGNLIGLNASGSNYVGNWVNGVAIDNAVNNDIGLSSVYTGPNTISGNNRTTTTDGVEISGSQASGNLVQFNDIGTSFGNRGAGVRIQLGADGSKVWSNQIRNNISGGVLVTASDSVGNSIQYNSIFENDGGLGIDLFPIGVTPNDVGDPDGGANNLQNFPSLTAYCDESGTTSTIWGTLNGSGPNKTYAIDLYNSAHANTSGYGEGQTWLGQASCTIVGATGSCTFSKVVNGCSLVFVTATATDPSSNTSEFSLAFPVPQ